MNTEDFYRAKAIKQLTQKRDMRFRENLNICFFILVAGTVIPLVLFWILK